jgi:hypothetical protein
LYKKTHQHPHILPSDLDRETAAAAQVIQDNLNELGV